MTYDRLCEMDIPNLMKSLGNMSTTSFQPPPSTCPKQTIQPDTNVGGFGNEKLKVMVTKCNDGGIEICSETMSVKLPQEVFEAIKMFVTKGEE